MIVLYIVTIYLFAGIVTYSFARTMKPLRYKREWKKQMYNEISSRGFAPSTAQVLYSLGMILVFPLTIWEYFVRKAPQPIKKFNHKSPKRKNNA